MRWPFMHFSDKQPKFGLNPENPDLFINNKSKLRRPYDIAEGCIGDIHGGHLQKSSHKINRTSDERDDLNIRLLQAREDEVLNRLHTSPTTSSQNLQVNSTCITHSY